MDNNNLLVALDVGSSKVAVIVAEPGSDGVVKICGLGSAPSAGIRNGVVIDINAAVGSIRAAFDEAERTSGLHISEVYTACEDPRLRFFNNTGATPVRGTEIGQEELDAATEHAGAVALQGDAKVLKMQVLCGWRGRDPEPRGNVREASGGNRASRLRSSDHGDKPLPLCEAERCRGETLADSGLGRG